MTGIKETPTHIYAKGDGYVVRVKGEHRGKYETLEKPSPPVTRSMMDGRRPKGAQNKITRDLKERLIEAAVTPR